MVVFIMLDSDPVSHEEHPVRQSPVAEEDLGAFFELVFCTAEHEKLIKFLIFPDLWEVFLARLDFGRLLCFFFGLSLSKSTGGVCRRLYFTMKPFHKIQVQAIIPLNPAYFNFLQW